MASIYDIRVRTIRGQETDLSPYRGKALLIVNTASQCGLTPQYEGLQKLYETYGDRGFAVLGFPCNQFGGQEPGTGEEIGEFCRLKYGVTFPLFEKIDVNGPNAHPLYRYLKEQAPYQGEPDETGDDIKWNFTKFLIGRDGRAVARFEPGTPPADLAPEIEKLL